MNRKVVFLIVCALVMGLFSGCQKASPATVEPVQVEQDATPESQPESINPNSKKAALIVQVGGLGDEGLNDGAHLGMKKASEELGLEFVVVEPTEAAETQTYLRQLGEEGYGLVICMEYGAIAWSEATAKEYPDTTFVQFGDLGTEHEAPNYVGFAGEVWNTAFLGGIAAGFVAQDGNELVEGRGSKPGSKIGIVFGLESVGFYQFEDAFKQGIREVCADCEVIVDYNGGFEDTQNVKTITENMINNLGVDVVWLACGTAGLGGLQAVRLNNAYAIGVDLDQDWIEPGYVITSVRYDFESGIFHVIESWVKDEMPQGLFLFTLENGGIDITDMSTIAEFVTNHEKFEELKGILAEKRQAIIDEEIIVHNTVYLNGERYPWP
ncbi:MAG: BMP family ABC transporter substrate-binding protein [Chloroflexi bacterium]|nr:BMP family ABC transporter substrate-binding protein [Chloroflexota bacterium]